MVANQQVKYTGGFITDTLGWTKITGSFTAQGGEEYLTIGFFEDTTNHIGVLPLIPDTVSLGYFSVYYYIDGITLKEISDTVNTTKCNEIMPNVFTPNNDSVNDILKFNICNKVLKTAIYTRWGILMFESYKSNPFWDGRTTSGEECTDGIYFYVIETEEKTHKGFIQLLR